MGVRLGLLGFLTALLLVPAAAARQTNVAAEGELTGEGTSYVLEVTTAAATRSSACATPRRRGRGSCP